tara:strand:+ start:228 stop:611 length:384 start_codon:yes stop_codon:yes gene_type:complete
MAKIILSETSVMGRLRIGREEITREVSCEISALKGLLKMQDPNLLITFEESDEEELLGLDDKILEISQRVLNLSDIPKGSDLVALLLPKKSVAKKAKTTAKKAAKKVKDTVVPSKTEEIVEESPDSE